ncbi:GtrA family protein [Compostimonas suwonensis]|uniref:Putative flippase GtrA n=1 Tax=Compostimonas suwonensis TaxID=1048394 RepID=A0A2M9BV53_9MICO|nr:GtrA family protein [Compostimonas suwonensis]PJJ61762.1 putative flippase GtrA [Compostimonas suwonensis]
MTTVTPSRWSALIGQILKFGAVGAVGLVIDVVISNVLWLTVLAPSVVHEGPIIAKFISTVVAIFANWIGNRYWTFAKDRQKNTMREGIEFFAVSVVGMVIPLLCLWVTHYLLDFTSIWADNVSSNVIGLGLGAVFRFVLYRYWVYAPNRKHRTLRPPAEALPLAPDSGLV